MLRKYNEGDWVTCLPGFHNGRSTEPEFGGRGYVEGYTFKIQQMKQPTQGIPYFQMPRVVHRGWAYFPDDISNGIYEIALRKATPEEIDAASKTFECCVEDETNPETKRCHNQCSTCKDKTNAMTEWLKENPPFGGPYVKPKVWTDDDMREAWMGKQDSPLFFEDWLEQYKRYENK